MLSCATKCGRAGKSPRGQDIIGVPTRLNGRIIDVKGGKPTVGGLDINDC